jgi:hypothetical protein
MSPEIFNQLLRLIPLLSNKHRKAGAQHVSYLSAKKASAQKRARIPKENGNTKRPQGSCPAQGKGQSAALLLSAMGVNLLNQTSIFQGGIFRPLGAFHEKMHLEVDETERAG